MNSSKLFSRTSSQDGGIGRYTLLRHTTKRSTTTNLKQKQPELTENQTVWKSNNQGVKEETFIQENKQRWAAQRRGPVAR